MLQRQFKEVAVMQANANRRNKWADRIERCLSSNMSGRLSKLNHLRESRLYRWFARFRKEEPQRFPRRNAATAN